MARIFLSHSSRDKEHAERLLAYLRLQNFQQTFLDFDKHCGIPPGANWERTLYSELQRADAVIVLLTPNWFDSKWCFAEFIHSRALGKEIFPVIAAPIGDFKVSPELQHLTLLENAQENLERLTKQLTRISHDAQSGFIWDQSRAPYPGLLAFQEEDAAIFFGRQVEVRRVIERLNARRIYGDRNLVVLLGPSGSGKSSLLRAGVIPRIKRDRQSWIVLPTIRPHREPIDELARAIAVFLERPHDFPALREQLLASPAKLDPSNLANDLRAYARSTGSQILIPIDQGEELFTLADKSAADAFMKLVSIFLQAHTPFTAVIAMRSDALQQLQQASSLSVEFEEFSLRPIPPSAIRDIILGPARVGGLAIDNALVDAVVRDAVTEDLLPLLAFTLRELYERFGKEGKLTLAQYLSLGDMEYQLRGRGAGLNPIENTIRQKADQLLATNGFGARELSLLKASFLSGLAGINDEGQFVRRPSRWDDLSVDAQTILTVFVNERLLVTYTDGDDKYVEVVHEALLRKWPTLAQWLDNERVFLEWLKRIRQECRLWELAHQDEKSRFLLSGHNIGDAKKWLTTKSELVPNQLRLFIRASLARAAYRETFISAVFLATALYLVIFYPVAFLANAAWLGLAKISKALEVETFWSELVTTFAKAGIIGLAKGIEIIFGATYLGIIFKYGFRMYESSLMYLRREIRSPSALFSWLHRQYIDRIGIFRGQADGRLRSTGDHVLAWGPLFFGIIAGVLILYKIWTPLLPSVYTVRRYVELPFEPVTIFAIPVTACLLGALMSNLLGRSAFRLMLWILREKEIRDEEPLEISSGESPPDVFALTASHRLYLYFIVAFPFMLWVSFLHAWLSFLGSVPHVNPLSALRPD